MFSFVLDFVTREKKIAPKLRRGHAEMAHLVATSLAPYQEIKVVK